MVLIAMAVVHVLPSRGILTHAAASGHGLDWEQAQIPKHSPTQLVSATDGCELLRCTQAARAQDLDFISSQRAGDACALQSPSPRNGYGKHFASTQRPCAMCRSLSPPPPPAPSADDGGDDDYNHGDDAEGQGDAGRSALALPFGSTRLLLRGGAPPHLPDNATKPMSWHKWWTHDEWWERLPASDWNPVTIWWRIKQRGPYTKWGLNHMNPICKIIAFQMSEMLHLQTLALMGQVSKVIDKSLRPKLTEENWFDLFYYSIFSCIHVRQIVKILKEKQPIQFSEEDLELYELVFQHNQFSPRQFAELKKLANVRHVRKGALLAKPGHPIDELLVLVRGECGVSVKGKLTNVVKAGGFVGELEFLRAEEQAEDREKEKERDKDRDKPATLEPAMHQSGSSGRGDGSAGAKHDGHTGAVDIMVRDYVGVLTSQVSCFSFFPLFLASIPCG